ncbi:MAG: transcriptional repressor LexA [Spirochaetales bacterium]|nr:transcriptional repressor LexA [Spirochaetales bacterium]
MKGLTHRQKEVFDYINEYIKTRKYPPTVREVANHFDISVKGSHDHIKALEKKNYIRCNFNRSRAIEVLKMNDNAKKSPTAKVPLLGNVAAGKPLFAEENLEGTVEVPNAFVGNGTFFALNIKGDSMKDAGILDGDIAIIRHQNTAENGEIIVAMLDDSVTLKRVYQERYRVKLQSENPAYPPIYANNANILGKLACIIRKYD